MAERFAVLLGCVLLAVTTITPVSAADPPTPGTTDNDLTESEEATLWSNIPADHWETDDSQTTVHEIASETDLTFTEPPSTASRWTAYAHGTYEPGGTDRSVYPTTASPDSSSSIKDAHATIFAVAPSTRTHITPDETRNYVAPSGTLYGTVDYRLEVPESTQRGNWSYSWRLREHEIDEIRLYADGTQLAETHDTHRPTFEYDLTTDVDSLRLEADIDARLEETISPPADSNLSTRVRSHHDLITVTDSIAVDVYRQNAYARYATYPNGQTGVSVTQDTPWQGYTLDRVEEQSVRGVWRFFTARDTRWDRLVESTEHTTHTEDSDVLPVSVHAYPAAAGPRAKPEYDGPTIARTGGTTHRTPAASLPEHVTVDVVDTSYTETSTIAVRTPTTDSVTVHGLVYGTSTSLSNLFAEPREVRQSDLSAEITDRSQGEVRVRLTLTDAETGVPISLQEDARSSVLTEGTPGYIEINEQRVKTDERGEVTVTLSEPGRYSARYEPAPWLDVSPAYTGDTASVRWHPLTTIGAWIDFAVRFGLLLTPFLLALYAGRRLGRFLSRGHR